VPAHAGPGLKAHEPVERFGTLGARVGETPEHLRGVAQREVGAPGVDALGAEREVEVTPGGQTGLLQDRQDPLACGSGVGGRLEHHQLLARPGASSACRRGSARTWLPAARRGRPRCRSGRRRSRRPCARRCRRRSPAVGSSIWGRGDWLSSWTGRRSSPPDIPPAAARATARESLMGLLRGVAPAAPLLQLDCARLRRLVGEPLPELQDGIMCLRLSRAW
jgi:hypothetical protein